MCPSRRKAVQRWAWWITGSVVSFGAFATVLLVVRRWGFWLYPTTPDSSDRLSLALALATVAASAGAPLIWAANRERVRRLPAPVTSTLTAQRAATSSAGDGVLNAFVVTSEGGLFAALYQEPGAWSPWRDLRPNTPAVDVAAVVTSADRTEVFYVDEAA
jgi:hypothetical protein